MQGRLRDISGNAVGRSTFRLPVYSCAGAVRIGVGIYVGLDIVIIVGVGVGVGGGGGTIVADLLSAGYFRYTKR